MKQISIFLCRDVADAEQRIRQSNATCIAQVVIPPAVRTGKSRTERRRAAHQTKWTIVHLREGRKMRKETLEFGQFMAEKAIKAGATEIYVVGGEQSAEIMAMGLSQKEQEAVDVKIIR